MRSPNPNHFANPMPHHYLVRCPECCAPKGRFCRGLHGQSLTKVHGARTIAARPFAPRKTKVKEPHHV